MNKHDLLARRVREIRLEHFGEDGLEELAQALKIPAQMWLDYERGVGMPAAVLLAFLDVTGADARRLLADLWE
ncbi:MAG: hypothetical protein ACLQIB_06270 [Isosphaeraceae bacterium]